ncbi:MAG: thioredoxin-like domain-containing protein [Chitinophagaceae bacterium]
MNKLFICIFNVLIIFSTLAQNSTFNPKNDYEIDITLKPFKNQWVYLAYYFTNQTNKYLVDSVLLDNNSRAVFKGNNEAMNGGVYLIIFPGKSKFIEFIIDSNKKFAITIDTVNLDNIKFTNSPENNDFYAYQQFLKKTKEKYQKLDSNLRASRVMDSNAPRQNMINQYKEINAYTKAYTKKNSHQFLSTLFLLMDGPEIIQQPNAIDSLEYFFYHYWDNISFSDPKILRTPILEQKLNQYIRTLIPNKLDSMTNVAFNIIEEAKKDSLTYRYYLSKLAIDYGNSVIPIQSDAFYYIFNKYIENSKPSWMSDNLYDQMQRRSNFIVGNIIGNNAYDIELLDTTDKKFNLYDIKSNYIVLCFWDPVCGHCLEIMPLLDSLYQNSWEKKGVTMVGIYVDGGLENWKKYISTHNKKWLHGYESDTMRSVLNTQQKPNFRQLFNVTETPKIYLLDKDKKIVLKQITPLQLNQYFEYLEKRNLENTTNQKTSVAPPKQSNSKEVGAKVNS